MNYKVAICDDSVDELAYLTMIAKRWAEYAKNTVTISTFPSAEAFLFQYAEEKDFDILLLDIEMEEMNGVELAKQVRLDNEKVQIVFITGFADFISEGYEVSALHYLMKPVSEEKLSSVLDRAADKLQKTEKLLQIVYNRETAYVALGQILYVEAQKQFVLIYTQEKVYRMKRSLTDMEKQLDEYFFKCQRSFLVNLRYVARIQNTCVILKNGVEIPISRGSAESIGKAIIRLF